MTHLATRLGIDGLAPSAILSDPTCCPPSLCQIDACALACNFVHSLPSGPLWDKAKRTALAKLSCAEPITFDETCTSIVAYAGQAGLHLHMLLREALWPAIRESHPATAFDTLDDWLDRLGWQDCFRCACDCIDYDRGEGRPPYELIQSDGRSICCPSEAPEGLTQAVKKNIVIALWRLRLGIIANLDSINFVIEPLGAHLAPDPETEDGCCVPAFILSPISDSIAAACLIECPRGEPCPAVQAYWLLNCDGAGDDRRIYPGILAAECIVRSILADRRVTITRT